MKYVGQTAPSPGHAGMRGPHKRERLCQTRAHRPCPPPLPAVIPRFAVSTRAHSVGAPHHHAIAAKRAEARRQLGNKYLARRVVLTRLVNIEEPVNLFEVAAVGDERAEFFRASEAALDALEHALDVLKRQGRFDKSLFAHAARQAGALIEDRPSDGPLILTLSRATEALVRDGQGCEKVWLPPGK